MEDLEDILELNETHKIIGHIYKIINVINNKCYIGQTRSHRLNRKKYRPFGYIGRFKDHISESKSTTKKHKCTYLNNAILKYGEDNFKVELLTTCNVNELDDYEVKYITEYNSKYPNGYNLTNGGQCKYFKKGPKIILEKEDLHVIEESNNERYKYKHTENTKNIISRRLTEYKNKQENKIKSMNITQKQHYDKKFDRFKDDILDKDDLDQYIKIIKNNKENYSYVCVKINKKRANFVGKYEDIEITKQRARDFILDLLKWQDTLLRELP
jgi:group I intron endonuclease